MDPMNMHELNLNIFWSHKMFVLSHSTAEEEYEDDDGEKQAEIDQVEQILFGVYLWDLLWGTFCLLFNISPQNHWPPVHHPSLTVAVQ